MNVTERIAAFLDGSPFAVVGASREREKYGNKALRAYLQRGLEVSAEIDFIGSCGFTRRWSSPRERCHSRSPI